MSGLLLAIAVTRRAAAPALTTTTLAALAALAALAIAAALALPAAPAAAAAGAAALQPDDDDEVSVEVNPSTVQAGGQVRIRARCDEDPGPATVSSRAFGEVTLTAREGQRLRTGSVTVPSSTRPGQHPVNLRCAGGATASTSLFIVDMAQPTRGPKTGGGGLAGGPAEPDPAAGGGGPAAGPVLAAGAAVAALAAGAALLVRRRRRAG